MHVQVVEAAARRALAAERAQQQALQVSCQTTAKPAHSDAAPSTSGMVTPSLSTACDTELSNLLNSRASHPLLECVQVVFLCSRLQQPATSILIPSPLPSSTSLVRHGRHARLHLQPGHT